MGTGYLIDTNVIIDYLDNKLPADGMALLNEIVDSNPIISVITKIEVLRFNTQKETYKILSDFINETMILSLDDVVVERTIETCKKYRIKLPDAIIASTALVYDLKLLTRNVDDFRKIANLQIINPHLIK